MPSLSQKLTLNQRRRRMSRLPPPEQWVLCKMNEMEVAGMIEQHIEYYKEDKGGNVRSVHLPTSFVQHFKKRHDGVVDTQHVADRMDAAHGRLAYVATFRLVALVRGATLVADIERVGREPAAVFRTDVGRQLGLGNAVGAALVVNQAARPELRNGDETSALEISGF